MTKTVLLIGANGGVGTATCRALISRGHRVVATVSRPSKLDAFQRDTKGCLRAFPLALDDGDHVRQALQDAIADLPQIDATIMCAAALPMAPLEIMPLAAFRRTLEINCTSHLAIFQAVMPALRRSRGRIVFIGSSSGRIATPMQGAYCCSKFGLEALCDVMRQEAATWGVEVTLLQIGGTDTPGVERAVCNVEADMAGLSEQDERLYGSLYRQMLARVKQASSAGVLQSPSVVASTVIQVLEAEIPEPRYRVGRDAEMLIELSRTKSDREIDAIVLEAYQASPRSIATS